MKKIYYLASALIFSGGVMAQYGTVEASKSYSIPAPAGHAISSDERAAGDPIGSLMDFSTPSDWTIANTGTPSSNWVIGTAGPTGSFSGGMGPIASTSGGNFAKFDSDALGSGSSVQNATITMASPINLSTYSNVSISFESYYRNFQGDCFVGVSTNGTTWTNYPVHALLPLNESTENPEFVEINISSVAANQATVWVRFQYVGGWDYAWMIDDVQFAEGYNDNLIMNQTYLYGGPQQLDYYIIPTSQIMDFTFGAWVTNNGVNAQNSTILNVKVNDGSSDIYNQSSAPVTVPAFGIDSLEWGTSTAWTPPGAGTYTVTHTVSSSATDQAPADNVVVHEDIIIGGNVYARDNGVVTGAVSYLGDLPANPTTLGNYFEFANPFALGKIQIGLGNSAAVGSIIFGEVQYWDGSAWVFVDVTPDYTITGADQGNIVTLTLPSVINCAAGSIYFIGAGHYGGPVAADLPSIQTAQIAEGAVIYNDGAASQQNSVFVVRAEEVFTGIEETENLVGMSVYPNPANGQVTLNYNIATTAPVQLTVTDIAGNVVMTNDFGVQPAGTYNSTLSTSALADGLYFYTLTVDGIATTKQLSVANK